MEFLKAIKNRRSVYALSKSSPVSDERIIEIVEEATLLTPSAFHAQCQKVAILFGKRHDKLWDIALSVLKKVVPAEGFAATEAKINSFKSAYATVLFFNDDSIIQKQQEAFPLYANNFPIWAEQANGMLQFAVWNLLEAEGLGANLQHYNPLIDEEVKVIFDIPKEWRLIAQMPLGKSMADPDGKVFVDISTRVKILR